MRRRGSQYWLWVNKQLPGNIHDESLRDGRQVEVHARITRRGEVQTVDADAELTHVPRQD
ncbi:hypothetical protein D3C71_2162000 [compost metagenome]